MPIYEYQSVEPVSGCAKCCDAFEVIRPVGAPPLSACPECGAHVERVVSRCRAVIAAGDAAGAQVGKNIAEYERQGKWSHAAELAEKQAAKSSDKALRERAFDNYQKAGYDTRTIEKQAKKAAAP